MNYRVEATVRGDNSWCMKQKEAFDNRLSGQGMPRTTLEHEAGSGSGRLVFICDGVEAPNAWVAIERATQRATDQVPQLITDVIVLDVSAEIEGPAQGY